MKLSTRLAATILGLFVLLVAAPATAADPTPPDPSPPAVGFEPHPSAYGWQILIGAALFDGMTIGGLATKEEPGAAIALAGVSGRNVTGPTIHFLHGQTKAGFLSLALNPALSLGGASLGAVIGKAACTGHTGWFPCLSELERGLFTGYAVGAAAATVVDVAVLAYEDSPAPAGAVRQAQREQAPSWTWAPAISRESGGVFVSGQF